MKMVDCLESRAAARLELQKLTHGGVGFSGIAATACASVMSKDQSPIVTSICERQPRISQPISMYNNVNLSEQPELFNHFHFILF